MLGMVGLLGAVLAGLAVDGLFSSMMARSDDHDDDADPDQTKTADHAGTDTNLLDWLSTESDADDAPDGTANGGPDDPDYVPTSNDFTHGTDPDLVLHGDGLDDILTGRGGDDSLTGGGSDDQLLGQGGADFIDGGDGSDVAQGGMGDDTLLGGAGNDMLVGENGDDRLIGGAGADTLLGHDGDDGLYGGAGADTVIDGGGDDSLIGGGADDWLAGGYGNDSLIGDAGQDELDGGVGNDTLYGRESVNAFPETDFLNGGDGDDRLVLGGGDYATGGDGADWFELPDLATDGEIANIADFNAGEDSLIVVFDPTMHPDPQISFETQENAIDVVVVLDGVPLAMVQGGAGMTIDDVLLTPAQAA